MRLMLQVTRYKIFKDNATWEKFKKEELNTIPDFPVEDFERTGNGVISKPGKEDGDETVFRVGELKYDDEDPADREPPFDFNFEDYYDKDGNYVGPKDQTKIPWNNGFYSGPYNPNLPVIDPTAPAKEES